MNGDGIFNSQACRDTIREILGNDVELFASVNPRNKKDIENPARGIAKITKHGNVQCIAGHDMVFLSKDYNQDAYIFGCPVLNEEARRKLEHMGLEMPEQCECEKKEECSQNSEIVSGSYQILIIAKTVRHRTQGARQNLESCAQFKEATL